MTVAAAAIDSSVEHAVQAAFKRAEDIDFSPIKRKLMDERHGSGWSRQKADDAEYLYRCFLALQVAYDQTVNRIVPPTIVDEFWHQHILDTRKYAADCEVLFGKYLHHFPYFGMRGPEDERALNDAAEWTLAQFSHHFGSAASHLLEASSCSSCGRCASCRSS
ncbi:MAG: hypothetical protein FJ254_09440 [Phycisphaerae bacterium]|nr:hypothetical protein [Phycisphaerae bacterium]